MAESPVPGQRVLDEVEKGLLTVSPAKTEVGSNAKKPSCGWHRHYEGWQPTTKSLETRARRRNVSWRWWSCKESSSQDRWSEFGQERSTYRTSDPLVQTCTETDFAVVSRRVWRPGNPHLRSHEGELYGLTPYIRDSDLRSWTLMFWFSFNFSLLFH